MTQHADPLSNTTLRHLIIEHILRVDEGEVAHAVELYVAKWTRAELLERYQRMVKEGEIA